MRTLLAAIRSHLADAGRVAYASALVLALAALLLELFAPGIVGNYVTPQHLVAFAAIAAACTLLEDAPTSSTTGPLRAAAVALVVVVACAAAWRSLSTMPDAQWAVTVAVGFTVLLASFAYARPSGRR